MGVIVRQSIIKTFISYVGVALGFVITIWLYPNFLTTTQYGLTRVMLSLSMVLIQFSSFGNSNTIIRYFPYFRDEDNSHHGFLPIVLLIPLAGFIIFGSLLFIFREPVLKLYADNSALLLNYYYLLFPLAFFILFFKTIERFTYALYNTIASSFLHDILLRLLIIAFLFAYFWQWISFKQFMLLFVMSYGLNLLLLSLYLFKISNVSFRLEPDFLSIGLIKKMLNYGAYSFFGNIATVILGNIDILMLAALANLSDTGVYAIAFYIGSALKIPRQSILSISSPMISDAFKNKDDEMISDIYKRSALNLFIIGGLLFCGIIANLPNLNQILPPAYTGGALVVLIIAIGTYFEISTGINGAIIINSKHYRVDLFMTVLLIIVTVVLNLFLIPKYGILGAAIGTATAEIVYNSAKVLYVWITFSLHPLDERMLPTLLLVGVTLFASLATGQLSNPYLDIILRSLIITGFYLTFANLLNLSDDLNKLMHHTFSKAKKLIPF